MLALISYLYPYIFHNIFKIAKFNNFNFHAIEVVSRYCDPQLRVIQN